MDIKPIELLAPAGSPDAYKAAAAAGADAVYLGAKGFNARVQAQNFSDGDLVTVIDDAHIRGIKVYLVLNTLIGENEIQEAATLASFVYQQGIDGIIVQDLGLVKLLKEIAPQLPLHASTQMTLHNIDGVKAAHQLGIERVVLSRELTMEEIRDISINTGIQLEVFVHGALCISRSGQCLLSSFIGGRSGNRGRCAQPCRLPWKNEIASPSGKYLISPRDLMTLEFLPQLINTGVSSLKIEGRMKSPEYVAAVVMVYRKYLDMALSNPFGYKVDAQDICMLEQVFNRGGFTTGYLKGRNFQQLMSTEHPKHWGVPAGTVEQQEGSIRSKFGGGEDDRLVRIKLKTEIRMGDGLEIWDDRNDNPSAIISVMLRNNTHVKIAQPGDSLLVGNFKTDATEGSPVYKTYDKETMAFLSANIEKNTARVPVVGRFHLLVGEKPLFTVMDENGSEVSAEGKEITQEAASKPVTQERVEEQLKKTGDTPYYFREIHVNTDNKSYIPVSVINEMRRQALEILSDNRKTSSKRISTTQTHLDFSHFPGNTNKLTKHREIGLYFYKVPGDLSWQRLHAERVYLPITEPGLFDTARENGVEGYAWIPAVLSDHQLEGYVQKVASIRTKLDGVMVGNLGMLHRIRSTFPDIPVALDFQMNVFNSWAIEALKQFKPSSITLSVELNTDSISTIKSPEIPLEAYIYGEIPVMTLEYCPASEQGSCSEKCGKCDRSRGYLIDRMEKRFFYQTDPILRRTTLYNCSRLMLEDTRPLRNTDVTLLRIGVMDESPQEIHDLCRFYHEQWVEGKEEAALEPNFLKRLKERGLTKGHYFRGAD